MLGIIESSARYAQEAAARQRQQTYDNDICNLVLIGENVSE